MEKLYALLRKINESVDWNISDKCSHSTKVGCDCIACTSGQYFDGRPVDYSCDQRRRVYLLRYLHVHLQEVCSAFDGLRRHDTHLPEWAEKVKVLSIGGGPGSDIAGFRRFVVDYGFYSEVSKQFEITRLERVTEWDALATKVFPIFSADALTFEHNKIHADIKGFKPSKDDPYDIIIMSYVISELDDVTLDVLVKAINKALATRGVLIINDRNEDAVVAKIEKLLSNLRVLAQSRSDDERWCGILYPDDLIDVVKPKRNMTSVRIGAIVERL